tara:strand:- start:945 stop:1286 length:342 start_codon:yes stop_codon:yes gene_type:complete
MSTPYSASNIVPELLTLSQHLDSTNSYTNYKKFLTGDYTVSLVDFTKALTNVCQYNNQYNSIDYTPEFFEKLNEDELRNIFSFLLNFHLFTSKLLLSNKDQLKKTFLNQEPLF